VKYFFLFFGTISKLFGTISKLLTRKTKDELHKCITKRSTRKYFRLRRLIWRKGRGKGGEGEKSRAFKSLLVKKSLGK
jgi:hypothetical protein